MAALSGTLEIDLFVQSLTSGGSGEAYSHHFSWRIQLPQIARSLLVSIGDFEDDQ